MNKLLRLLPSKHNIKRLMEKDQKYILKKLKDKKKSIVPVNRAICEDLQGNQQIF